MGGKAKRREQHLSWRKHAAATAHVAEGTLTGAVGPATGHTGDTRHSATCSKNADPQSHPHPQPQADPCYSLSLSLQPPPLWSPGCMMRLELRLEL